MITFNDRPAAWVTVIDCNDTERRYQYHWKDSDPMKAEHRSTAALAHTIAIYSYTIPSAQMLIFSRASDIQVLVGPDREGLGKLHTV